MNYEWQLRTAPEPKVREYMQELGISRIMAAGFINQSLSIDAVDVIFNNNYDGIYHPLAIARIHDAAMLIKEYLDKPDSAIQIFADYDTDGITSAAILTKGLLRILDALYPAKDMSIMYTIPERKDGYGLSVKFAEQFVSMARDRQDTEFLVITVDNGITAKPAIDILLQEPNIRVLVTDHHEPDYENHLTPTEDCICVNPHLNPDGPGHLLAGCGVIFNVLQELEELYGLDHDITSSLLYLNAIGTIGDMMEDDLYNVCIKGYGITQLNAEEPAAWVKKVHEKTGINWFTTKDIGFTISPMINSCGQMGHAVLAYQMLISSEPKEVAELVDRVYDIYLENRAETKYAREMAEADIMENYIGRHKFILYPMQTDHPGLVSKVATHLSKQIGLPLILWGETQENANEEVVAGSARNDTAIPIMIYMREAVRNGLAESAEGHSYAFGVKLIRSKLRELQDFLDAKIIDYEEKHNGIIVQSRNLLIDCVISTDEINAANMQNLERFPFGKSYPAPVVLIQGARIIKTSTSKNNPKNICYTIQSPGARYPIDIWAWNIKPEEYKAGEHTKIDMVGTIERNFMKPKYATLNVIDLRTYA